jgi:hypothetical protein
MAELMMEAQGADALTLGRLFGSDASSPLHYTSSLNFAGQNLSYSTVPGSEYLGQPITVSGSVSYNPGNGSYLFNSFGILGATRWSSTGSFVGAGPTYPEPGLEKPVTFTIFIPPINDMEFVIDWATYPDQTDSVVGVTFTVLGVKVASGNSWDVLDTNGLTTGDWYWDFTGTDVNQHAFKVETSGFTELADGGGGSFTQYILPTPEPSSLLLLGSGILGLSGFVRKRLLTRS